MSKTRTQQLREHIIAQLQNGKLSKQEVLESIPQQISDLYAGPNGLSGALHALWASARAEVEELEETSGGLMDQASQRVRQSAHDLRERAEEAVTRVSERVRSKIPADRSDLHACCREAKPYVLGAAAALLAVLALAGRKK